MSRDGWCSVIHLGEDNARFGLLALVLIMYMLCGAALFSALESNSENELRREWTRVYRDFMVQYNGTVNETDVWVLLHHYGNVSAKGLLDKRPRWDFAGAFYYVLTIVTTIGFGMTTPQTVWGKVATMIFGIVGCAGGILFFNLFLERIISFLAYVLRAYHRRKLKLISDATSGDHRRDSDVSRDDPLSDYKPSVYWVMLYLFLGATAIAIIASSAFTTTETWSYLESFYFCMVTFTTIGFGDFVSNQRPEYKNQILYGIGNFFFIVLGCSCVYSLLNVISIVIKQFLNFLIYKLNCSCKKEKPPTPTSRPRRNAIAPSFSKKHNGRQHNHANNSKVSVAVVDVNSSESKDDGEDDGSDGDSRRNSGEMISMHDMLVMNKVSLAVMQKQLYETANRNYIDPEHHPTGGLSGGIGPLAILNEKLGDDM